MTTTNQKKNTTIPGRAYPATLLALATAPGYPVPPGLSATGVTLASGRRRMLDKHVHFHLHDGHLLIPGLSDHFTFLTRLPVPFSYQGRRSLDMLYGQAAWGPSCRQLPRHAARRERPSLWRFTRSKVGCRSLIARLSRLRRCCFQARSSGFQPAREKNQSPGRAATAGTGLRRFRCPGRSPFAFCPVWLLLLRVHHLAGQCRRLPCCPDRRRGARPDRPGIPQPKSSRSRLHGCR